MLDTRENMMLTPDQLTIAVQKETQKFQDCYNWLEKSMSPSFFNELGNDNLMLVTHALMGFPLQDYFSTINIKGGAIVICLDEADADLKILENYTLYGIKHYRAFVSQNPPPYPGITKNLRIVSLYFTDALETMENCYPPDQKEKLRHLIKERNPKLTDVEIDRLISGFDSRFLRALPEDRLILTLDMFFRAQTRDNCQYEVTYDPEWASKGNAAENASMYIVLAWRNTPKNNFLYRLARTIHRNGLVMKGVNATYVNPYSTESILLMTLGLHGSKGEDSWEVADIPNFLRELATVKYFASFDTIDKQLISKGIVSGTMGNLLRSMVNFIHQVLVQIDPHLYSIEHIELDLCRHPEFTSKICEAFKYRFDPDFVNLEKFNHLRHELLNDIQKLDTGNEENDLRRKNVLKQAINMVTYTLKTNFYRRNYTALAFRLDPHYLDDIPFKRSEKFPELPYAIFFTKGMHFFGFHIRFKDLSRGGLRTIYPEQIEKVIVERNNVFHECYWLAYTQHKKNKDIPEGGAKGVIFLKPYERLGIETEILKKELTATKTDPKIIEEKVESFRNEQKTEYLYHAQRSYIESILSIVNCYADGKLKNKYIIDYWKRPEYLYLGPDENMHSSMIQWIADYSKRHGYKPGSSFISSKPQGGINHKEYGVTSLGINVYLHELLRYMGIDPQQQPFTVKMSGGPDGDVAGNQICNLYRDYQKNSKILAITDISGTIYDPHGLDLPILVKLFKEAKPIRFYPAEMLSKGGFLVDKDTKRIQTAFVQQTLCRKKEGGKVVDEWLTGSDMNALVRHQMHHTKTDIFIPAGGRPGTLNEGNFREFLNPKGEPTSKAIIEGANLYLTEEARLSLEKLGVLIIKDSSANKTGVICSSFEVLCGLALGDEEFIANKEQLVKEIIERLQVCAFNEARILLKTHQESGGYLSEISELISERINHYTYQILDYLEEQPLPTNLDHPLIKCFLSYCLPTLRTRFQDKLMSEIPELHKKAIIACHIGAQIVYKKGLQWSPTIVNILPIILSDSELIS